MKETAEKLRALLLVIRKDREEIAPKIPTVSGELRAEWNEVEQAWEKFLAEHIWLRGFDIVTEREICDFNESMLFVIREFRDSYEDIAVSLELERPDEHTT